MGRTAQAVSDLLTNRAECSPEVLFERLRRLRETLRLQETKHLRGATRGMDVDRRTTAKYFTNLVQPDAFEFNRGGFMPVCDQRRSGGRYDQTIRYPD